MNHIPNGQIRHQQSNGTSLENSNSANTGTSTRNASNRGRFISMMLFVASTWAFIDSFASPGTEGRCDGKYCQTLLC